MHLTRVLHFFKRYQKVPGRLYEGKKRAMPALDRHRKANMVRHLLREEDNLQILENHYLSKEEEYGISKQMIAEGIKERKSYPQHVAKRWQEHKLISEHLEHLNVTKAWE